MSREQDVRGAIPFLSFSEEQKNEFSKPYLREREGVEELFGMLSELSSGILGYQRRAFPGSSERERAALCDYIMQSEVQSLLERVPSPLKAHARRCEGRRRAECALFNPNHAPAAR
jgi:hypothetical protein